MNAITLERMDNRLLLSKPRRQRWPRKTPSFVKMVAVSQDSLKPFQQEISLHPRIQSKSMKMFSETMECLTNNTAGYTAYEFLGHWLTVILYNPFGFAAETCTNGLEALLNLPPIFTMIVFPCITCYLVHITVQWMLYEYQSFLDLGRGGTPSTPMGLIKVSIKKFFAHVDVLDPPHVDPMLEPYRGQLFDLPKRKGVRPIVKGVAPQRQFDQKTPITTFNRLLRMLKDTAAKDENLKVATSYLEGHTDALKAIFPDRPHEVLGTDSEWDFEIAHPHRNDGSLHCILHESDCGAVIEAGWGEKHPLATDAWWWKTFFHHIRGKRRPVPHNLVLVYAPRTEAENAITQQIIDAAVWFSKEKDICDKVNQGLLARSHEGDIIPREEALDSGDWVEGPDGKLMTKERGLDKGLYKLLSDGVSVRPTFNLMQRQSPASGKCCN